MSRPLSLAARHALTASETDEVFLILLTIASAEMAVPIRVVNDRANLVSRGATFIAFPFDLVLPTDDGETLSQVQLRIDNVDREIVAAIRQLTTPPDVTLEVVRAAEPDVIEAGPFAMQLVAADYTALVVTGTLAFEDVLNARFPGDDFAPASHPGLF
jgi:hypothetical protein